MTEDLVKVADEYLDKFITSDLILIKIKDKNYPTDTLKRIFLERISKRDLSDITSYTFMNELYLEKI